MMVRLLRMWSGSFVISTYCALAMERNRCNTSITIPLHISSWHDALQFYKKNKRLGSNEKKFHDICITYAQNNVALPWTVYCYEYQPDTLRKLFVHQMYEAVPHYLENIDPVGASLRTTITSAITHLGADELDRRMKQVLRKQKKLVILKGSILLCTLLACAVIIRAQR